VNRPSIRKRDSKTSLKGARNAGGPGKLREGTAASEVSQETITPPAAGGNLQVQACSRRQIADADLLKTVNCRLQTYSDDNKRML